MVDDKMNKKHRHELKRKAERKLCKKLGIHSANWKAHKEANDRKRRNTNNNK